MGHKRPPARKANSVAKRRSSGSGRVTPRAPRKEVTPAQMRQMATKELLRRAALATPVIGGLSILGLLALSVAKGPDRPDAVVGSTSTARPGAVADEPSDEVAAGGDTVTADGPGGPAQRGPSDSDSVRSGDSDDGHGGGSAGGNEISAGDERRSPESVADPSGDHHRPRHDQPGSSGDEDQRGEPPGSDTIEIAGGLPYSGNGGNDRHDGGSQRHDGGVSVNANVNVDPVNVSVNATTGRPPAARTSTSNHHTTSTSRNGRPGTHGPDHSDRSGHKGVSVGSRAPSVVLPLPSADPVPGPDTEIHPVPSRRSGAPQTPTEIPDDTPGGGGLGRGNSIIDRLGRSIGDDKPPEGEAPTPAPEEEAPPTKPGGGSLIERLGRSISEAETPAEKPIPGNRANDDGADVETPEPEVPEAPEPEVPEAPEPEVPEAPEPEVPEAPEHEVPALDPEPEAQPPQVAETPPAEEVVPGPVAPPEDVVEEVVEAPPVSEWHEVAEPEPEPQPEDVVQEVVQEEEPATELGPELVEPQEVQPGVDPVAIEETDLLVETPSS